ncbi:hypothetical protein [Paludibaculum fermentans]|uniref:PepSY domain-containing protein n=1 Tax=Paludibaculum fermentans TaxID=1473598 RepID=A0A7S7NM54_PALFE|nr:hypothetical protein [Paludibaculum fermentans]QOY86104.1 hypothetical protein IRI77_25280 [Paludibaculum fermentans]
MNRTFLSISALGLLVVALTGCSDSAPPPKQAEVAKKPVEPVSGQSGLFQMFQIARPWASDVMILKLENGDIPEAKAQPGKYGLWRATFVSPSKKTKREYSFAVSDSDGGVIKGARAGAESPYSVSPLVHPIAIQDVHTDTTAALETALKEVAKDKVMSKALADNKDLPVQYILDWTGTNPKPYWRVVFGASVSQSLFSILIDAGTGEFVKKMH